MEIPLHFKIECEGCGKIHRTNQAIKEDHLPVTFRCPQTREIVFVLDKDSGHYPFPKIDPMSKHVGSWHLEQPKNSDDNSSRIVEVPNLPFREQADKIADLLGEGIQRVRHLQNDLGRLAAKMVEDFSEAWDMANTFRDDWIPDRMIHFIQNPFIVFDADPGTEEIYELMDFCPKWVMSPLFFEKVIGFPLETKGGFLTQVVNPYSTLTFPLNGFVSKVVDAGRTPDLKVVGNKIVGSDLKKFMEHIPGIIPDEDHTEDDPSVRIHHSKSARPYLASIGVNPWPETKLSVPVRESCAAVNIINGKELYRETFKRFIESNRLTIFWRESDKRHEFMSLVAQSVQGFKTIVYKEERTREAMQPTFASSMHIRETSVVYQSCDQVEENKNRLAQTPTVFVMEDVEAEWLQNLFVYSGNIIVFRDCNPIMDFFDGGWEASFVFGLTGKCSINKKDWWRTYVEEQKNDGGLISPSIVKEFSTYRRSSDSTGRKE